MYGTFKVINLTYHARTMFIDKYGHSCGLFALVSGAHTLEPSHGEYIGMESLYAKTGSLLTCPPKSVLNFKKLDGQIIDNLNFAF